MELSFKTARLFIRPFEISDSATIQELAGHIEVAKTTLNIPYPYPDGAAERWIEATLKGIENGESYAFALVRNDDGLLIGIMSLGVSRQHKRAELAYWVGRPYWGRGFATEAAKRIVQFGFEGKRGHSNSTF